MNRILVLILFCVIIIGSSCSKYRENNGESDYKTEGSIDEPDEITDGETGADTNDESSIDIQTETEDKIPANDSESQDAEEVISKNKVKIVYPNGDVYEGEMKKGMMDGYGIYTYANGDVYEGEFKENKQDGYGKLTSPNKFVYEGQMKKGMMDGYGIYTCLLYTSKDIEELVINRFRGTCRKYLVDINNQSIEF